MKTADSAKKKNELRGRFLEYAKAHAVDGRIPTVAELKNALGVTNYMLLGCMNDLVYEGLLTKKSRKEGIFLTGQPKKYVIGLIFESGENCEYVNIPAWLAGFCETFSKNDIFLLRMIQLSRIGDVSAIVRRLGLDALVYIGGFDNAGKLLGELSEEEKNKVLLNVSSTAFLPKNAILPEKNVLYMDQDYWLKEYVRASVECGCRSFMQFAPPDHGCGIFAGEVKKYGLPWSSDRHVTNLRDLPKKLPELIEKYQIDAVRCSGGVFQDTFCRVLEKYPDFRPFMPLFGAEHIRALLKECPWLNAVIIFEHLDNFFHRWGRFAGKAAKKIAANGTGLETTALQMKLIDHRKIKRNKK